MKIRITAFGPEITRLVEREQVIDLDPESTLEDLAQKLEGQIKDKHGWAPKLLRSNFTVLVNGRPSETLQDRVLKDGDVVAFLSPIGGGSEVRLEIKTQTSKRLQKVRAAEITSDRTVETKQ